MQEAFSLSPFVMSSQLSLRRQFFVSSLVIILVSGGCFIFASSLGTKVVAFLLMCSLSILALFFTILPVLWSALLSALIWDFFFIIPRFNFRIDSSEDAILLSMYFIVAIVNGILTAKIRKIEKAERFKQERERTSALYDTLLDSLSHELRTPIATIIGATDNLLEEPSRLSAESHKTLLSEIAIASIRLNRQVENLLNMSRLQSGFVRIRKDWVNLTELACQVIQSLETFLTDHTVKVSIMDGMPLIRLDYGLMEQVLYNLLHNAILYTEKGTIITIRATCRGADLEVIVEDDGKGIADSDAPRVFDKFYRPAHARPGGSGLGLSIVKGFVEAHNGSVVLSKGKSGGARFIIHIPAEKLYLN